MLKILLPLLVLSLTGCQYLVPPAPQISAAAEDPATFTNHTVITTPWATITTDSTRVNSTNTAATAGNTGTAVNVAPGATINSAPVKPAAGTTLTPGQPTTLPPG